MKFYSISRVNTFLENPFKHWCKYIGKYKPIKDPEREKYMDRGTVFHKAMELLAQGETDLSKVEKACVSLSKERNFTDYALETGLNTVKRYLEEKGMDGFKNVIHTEYKLEYPLYDDISFVGYVDAIVDNGDGTTTLVDYRTYSSAPTEDKHKYGLQANMYLYVANLLGLNANRFVFDCVNPKDKLTGRMYKTKQIEFSYNETRSQEVFEQFKLLVSMIEANQDFKLYTPGDYMPDVYDYFYKVYIGDINQDLDEFVAQNFITEE